MKIPKEHKKIVLGRIKRSKMIPGRMIDWNEGKSLDQVFRKRKAGPKRSEAIRTGS